MSYLWREELVKRIDSIYKLTNIASRRAVELSEGAQRLVDAAVTEKPINVALREILAKKVTLKMPAKEKKEE